MLRSWGLALGLIRYRVCLCTVFFRGILAKTLRVNTYISLIDSHNLQNIKELLWQATLRSNKNFFKAS